MSMPNEEIEKTLNHQRAIVRSLRQRLQQRELQEAQYGLSAPPEITIEIASLRERIQSHESEILRFQTLAAEDQLPLAEVEYRVLIAEAWETKKSRPSVAALARIELSRLKLGLPPERALAIEREVRIAQAREAMEKLDHALFLKYMPRGDRGGVSGIVSEISYVYQGIGRAIRLDPTITIQLFLRIAPTDLSIQGFRHLLLKNNNVWPHHNEYPIFLEFIAAIESSLVQNDS